MVNSIRKSFLALTVLGAFLLIAAGTAQAGWGEHSYTEPGESMSSEFGTMGENYLSYETSSESVEFSGYESEVAIETGRLPEDTRFEHGVLLGDGEDIESRLREGFIAGGGP